jgi:hypothetical protein
MTVTNPPKKFYASIEPKGSSLYLKNPRLHIYYSSTKTPTLTL